MSLKGSFKRTLLVICDGMGYSQNTNKNAVKDANTPNLDRFYKEYPFTTIIPGGEPVGLPNGVAGNSEVGHMNLGAGRPVRQDLVRINEAIEKDTLKDMEKIRELIQTAKDSNKRVHLMGLLSDGGVHSHIEHLKAIFNILNKEELEIYFHALMDGRDTPKTNGVSYLQAISDINIASVQGRSIGMDRDRRWEKIESAFKMMTGQSGVINEKATAYVQKQYDKEIFDEFITPALLLEEGAIKEDDCVFFINFRPDRAKQISQAFCDSHFSYFNNNIRPQYFLCMSPYIDEEFPEIPILFNREKVKMTFTEYLSINNKKVFKIAETEKYAHVTYFFNGGEEKPFNGEERCLINSPKDVATYDLKPQMSAPEVLDNLKSKLNDDSFSTYIVNFANPDMVGHTGNYEAAIKAMEYVDYCLGELEKVCINNDIAMLITADHGNCDEMVYKDGSAHTSHSKADVPCILITKNSNKDMIKVNSGKALKDVSPTLLYLMGMEYPKEFTGTTIFE